jgi:polysaccharide biosynthesis/export protein
MTRLARSRAVAGLTLGLALATGCSTNRGGTGPAPQQAIDGTTSAGDLMSERDRAALAAVSNGRTSGGHGDYRIGPDDLLDIRIPKLLSAQQAAMTASTTGATAAVPSLAAAPVFQQGVRVAANGDVTLPLIGTVPAARRTPAELEQQIAHRLVAGGILVNPAVSVQIAEHRSNVVAVVGSVERPGLYPLTRPGATIADFVWAAGGPTKDAGRVVDFAPVSTRDVRGEPIVIDLAVLLRDRSGVANALNPVAMAGDVLTVAPAGSVLVDGWVDKPGSYPVTRGLTLTGAVAAAGGHLFPADRQQVTVKRILGGHEQRIFKVDLDAVASGREPDFPITDGDVVHLPASTQRAVPYGVYQAAKEIIHVGASFPIF